MAMPQELQHQGGIGAVTADGTSYAQTLAQGAVGVAMGCGSPDPS